MTDSNVIERDVRDERHPGREPDTRITGLMVQYYHVASEEPMKD